MKFDFATANRILFGWGMLQEAGKIAAGFGRRAALITGTGAADPEPLCRVLQENQVSWRETRVSGEPEVGFIEETVSALRQWQPEVVIGFGGGSVIDTAKAVAALLANPGEVIDYLEVVGSNRPLTQPSLPCLAIPTTAGTGSEVTRNAVLAVAEKRVKVSLRSPTMIPRVAIIDPQLTISVPPAVTASTGMDALTQVLEPYVSNRSNPMTDMYCREGLQRASRSLAAVYREGNNRPAREDMAWTSLLGGLSLANAGLGAVHGFAGPIGGMFHAPHGAICARLLPLVFSANANAIQEREPGNPVLPRFKEVARILVGSMDAEIRDGALWLETLAETLKIPSLSSYGINLDDLDEIVQKSMAASSMKANPIGLTRAELRSILERAL